MFNIVVWDAWKTSKSLMPIVFQNIWNLNGSSSGSENSKTWKIQKCLKFLKVEWAFECPLNWAKPLVLNLGFFWKTTGNKIKKPFNILNAGPFKLKNFEDFKEV